MVEYRAVEGFGRGCELAGDALVGLARARIAARMIMRQNDRGATVGGGVGDDFAQGEVGAGLVSRVPRQMDAAGLTVEMGDEDMFAARSGIGDAAGKEVARGLEAVEFQGKFGTLKAHSCNLVHRAKRLHANRLECRGKSIHNGLVAALGRLPLPV